MGRARGSSLDLIRAVLGLELTGLRRYVLNGNGVLRESGHGITELSFGSVELAIGAGPNEESIVIAEGPVPPSRLDPQRWHRVDEDAQGAWKRLCGHAVRYVDCYSDGLEDVALVFHLEKGHRFSVVLCETDLVLARELEPFERSRRTKPRFRERLR